MRQPETRNAPTGKSQEFTAQPPAPPTAPTTSSGGGLGRTLAGAALATVGALGLLVFAPQSPLRALTRIPSLFAEKWSPAYQTHRLAQAGTPIYLTKKDLDVEATKAAIDAARRRQPIPRLAAASELYRNALLQGKVEIYTIRALDTCREDGDWITILAPNLSRQGSFGILHQPTLISVPVIKGMKAEIVLHADKDGVGGVTVGLQTSDGLWYSQVLDEGAVQQIPVVIR